MRKVFLLFSVLLVIVELMTGCIGSSSPPPRQAASTPSASFQPITINGSGTNVHIIYIPSDGVYLVSAQATPIGKTYGDFSVYFSDSTGLGYEGYGKGLMINEFVEPSYTGTESARLSTGKYLVSVESHCRYTITISSG
jgi:hypothetical protein